jgi:hypothetical protein
VPRSPFGEVRLKSLTYLSLPGLDCGRLQHLRFQQIKVLLKSNDRQTHCAQKRSIL